MQPASPLSSNSSSDNQPIQPISRQQEEAGGSARVHKDVERAAASLSQSSPDWTESKASVPMKRMLSIPRSVHGVSEVGISASGPEIAHTAAKQSATPRPTDASGVLESLPPAADNGAMELTKKSIAIFRLLEVLAVVNSIVRGGGYTITATSSEPWLTYTTLGVLAPTQFSAAYATGALGQLAEKIFTGEKQSNVEADQRKIITALRETMAVISQSESTITLPPELKKIITATLMAIYGAMLAVDAGSELYDAYGKVKETSVKEGFGEYSLMADKRLLIKLAGVALFLALGAALMGSAFGKRQESQPHQLMFAFGVAILLAGGIGGTSFLADHLKQTNRAFKYNKDGKNNIPKVTSGYDFSMVFRGAFALTTPTLALLASDVEHHETITKVIGAVTNFVVVLSLLLRVQSYKAMARLHVRQQGSGINKKPENTRATLGAFDKTWLGMASGPLTKKLTKNAKLDDSAIETDPDGTVRRVAMPRGWGAPDAA